MKPKDLPKVWYSRRGPIKEKGEGATAVGVREEKRVRSGGRKEEAMLKGPRQGSCIDRLKEVM